MLEPYPHPSEKYESRELLGGFLIGLGGLTGSTEFAIFMAQGSLPETQKGMIVAGAFAASALGLVLTGMKVDRSKWKYLDPPKEQ